MVDREEALFRDLSYTTSLYVAGEQMFPLWETIYAAIVGGLLITFFGTKTAFDGAVICLVGLSLSTQWAIIVRRNYQFSRIRVQHMRLVAKELMDVTATRGGEKVPLFSIYEKQDQLISRGLSTWTMRKGVPVQLVIVWLILIARLVFKAP